MALVAKHSDKPGAIAMCFTEDDDEAERFIRYAKRKKETIERVSDAEAVAMVGERLHWNRNG